MKRLLVTCVLALVLAPITSHASPAPSSGDCSWEENGQTIIVGDETYKCVCGRVTGPNGAEINCSWWPEGKLANRPAKRIHKAKPKRVTVRLVVRPVLA